MKVKIGNTIYDSSETAILLVMSSEEKRLIGEMPEKSNVFCMSKWNPILETRPAHDARMQEWINKLPSYSNRGADIPK